MRALALLAVLTVWTPGTYVQEPPARFAAQHGAATVIFLPAREVSNLCRLPSAPGSGPILACTLYTRPLPTIVMPNPWDCGPPALCAQLWRHETAHAMAGWNHEPR